MICVLQLVLPSPRWRSGLIVCSLNEGALGSMDDVQGICCAACKLKYCFWELR